jgi:hypothetical protein
MHPDFDIQTLRLTDGETEELRSSQLNDNIAFGIRCNVVLDIKTKDTITVRRWNTEARVGMAWRDEVRGLILTMSVSVKPTDTLEYIQARWERVVTEFVTHDLTPAIMAFGSVAIFDGEEFNDE